MKNPVLRWTLTILGVIAVMIAMFWAETYRRAHREFKEAEKCYREGDIEMAILWYGTVISFYTPFSPYVKKSFERLFEIGEDAEREGNYELAKEAYSEIVHRIYSIRSFYTPHKKIQEKAMALRDAVSEKLKE
jgi:hypothetical protein